MLAGALVVEYRQWMGLGKQLDAPSATDYRLRLPPGTSAEHSLLQQQPGPYLDDALFIPAIVES